MKRLKVSILVEVIIDADKEITHHFDVTGELLDSIKMSVERAEQRVQRVLDKHAKSLDAHTGADHGTVEVVEVNNGAPWGQKEGNYEVLGFPSRKPTNSSQSIAGPEESSEGTINSVCNQ